jgi:hypothetical protein
MHTHVHTPIYVYNIHASNHDLQFNVSVFQGAEHESR